MKAKGGRGVLRETLWHPRTHPKLTTLEDFGAGGTPKLTAATTKLKTNLTPDLID